VQRRESGELASQEISLDLQTASQFVQALRAPLRCAAAPQDAAEPLIDQHSWQLALAIGLVTRAWGPLFAVDGLGLTPARCVHISQQFTFSAPLAAGLRYRIEPTLTKIRRRQSHDVIEIEFAVTTPARRCATANTVLWSYHQEYAAPSLQAKSAGQNDADSQSEDEHAVIGRLTQTDLRGYAELSQDHNPIHTDAAAAAQLGFPGPIAHGMLLLGLAGQRLIDDHPGRWLSLAQAAFSAPLVVPQEGVQLRFHRVASPAAQPPAEQLNFQLSGSNGPLLSRARAHFAS